MDKSNFQDRLRVSSPEKKTTTRGVTELLLGGSNILKEDSLQETVYISIEKLTHFYQHPFKMYSSEKLQELADSIEQHGIYQPVIVRPLQKQSGCYEILAGHNRTEAARLAGKVEVPCRVIDCDDDDAILIVTETNLKQREKLFHSEKAKAYAMQMEALKRQGKRSDLTLSPLDTKLDAGKEIAKLNDESRASVFRYLRLNALNEALLDMVDQETIPFRAAIELSYLKLQEQCALVELLKQPDKYAITIELASELRKESKDMLLTEPMLEAILDPPKPEQKVHGLKPVYKKAFTGAQRQIKKFSPEQLETLEKMDEELLEKIIVSAIQRCIEAM